jgi:phosphoglycolate phosphatase
MTRFLFWDIDGTLLTTARAGVFALEEAAREVCGAEVDLQQLKTAGLTDAEVAAAAIEASGRQPTQESIEAFLRAYERHLPERLHWRQGSVLPGVRAVLDDLAARNGVKCLLLTGNTAAGARAKLAHYGLEGYFQDGAFCGVGDDRTAIARRARELAGALNGERVADGDIVVIGDTPSDVRCGLAIGARTVGVASGAYPSAALRDAGASVVIDELPEPARFAKLVGLR